MTGELVLMIFSSLDHGYWWLGPQQIERKILPNTLIFVPSPIQIIDNSNLVIFAN